MARQQFLPGLAERDGGFRAVWTPVLAGPDAEQLAKLARGMPAACRALHRKADAPPETGALALLTGFVEAVVDRLVRTEASGDDAVSGRGRGKAPAVFDSPHDQWLHALRSPDGFLHGPATELARRGEGGPPICQSTFPLAQPRG